MSFKICGTMAKGIFALVSLQLAAVGNVLLRARKLASRLRPGAPGRTRPASGARGARRAARRSGLGTLQGAAGEGRRSGFSVLRALGLAAVAMAVAGAMPGTSLCRAVRAQEGVFLTEEQAPAAVFPDADSFARKLIPATPALRAAVRALLGRVRPSVWEEQYVTFTAKRGSTVLGYALIVEEIGKHRPITFVVGVRADGRVNDVAVMAYREPYGGEVRRRRFLVQYRGKSAADSLHAPGDIKNIAGATLSVDAASRAVAKALAVARVALGAGERR